MTDINRDDLRAAVAAGMMSEAQAASLLTLAEQRSGVRQHMSGLDEPFELFRGFNEIFIVVGLVILWAGWLGVTGIGIFGNEAGYTGAVVFGLIGMAAAAVLSIYFTRKRRMVAPSILLAGLFGLSAVQVGAGIAWWNDAGTPAALTVSAGFATIALGFHYAIFRVPITVALMAVGVFATAFGAVTIGGTLPRSAEDIFLLTADGPFAILTFALGIVGFVIAMIFDMGDPHRVSLRSRAGFWLHVVSAPAIVNTVALTLLEVGTIGAQLALVVFILILAIVAIAIDRRSFLVAGVGYVVALSLTVLEDDGFIAILVLGLVLVLLGAKWEALRGWLMNRLPVFPGKDRLPPWTLIQGTP
ncbi:hypothetical protein HKCCE3408_02825 [Rhodobacterales bacterium HKCCE3408]|nr:hypothetical protein [Rhodobacterales bacterium HKCCE3408]